MAREIPEVVRAAAGLAATVLDEARRLPQTLPGLPVRVIGLAMQKAMWLQQQYSGLVARGDELFTGIRGEDEPGLATFDDDEPLPEQPDNGGGYRESAFDRAADLVEEDLAGVTGDAAPGAVITAVEGIEPEQVLEELVLEELAIEQLVDDETLGLPAEPSPAEVVAAVEDITDQVAAAITEEVAADVSGDTVTEDADALESALLGAGGAAGAADTVTADATGGAVAGDVAAGDVAAGEAVAGDLDAADSATAGAAAGDVASPDLDTTDSADLADEAAEALEPAVPEATPEPVEVAADAAEPVTEVDVLTPDGSGVTTAEATVTDEGVAAVDTPQESEEAQGPDTEVTGDLDAGAAEEGAVATEDGTGAAEEGTVATDEGGGEVAAATRAAGGTPPVEGYDAWSIAQLRGRMRGYQAKTVQELLGYEEATRAREPYLRMLRNRLQKLDEQAVEASPLAPRGV